LDSPSNGEEWVRAFDRASERDYFMYMNENLKKTEVEKSDMARLMVLHKSLLVRTTTEDCIQDFLIFGSQLWEIAARFISDFCRCERCSWRRKAMNWKIWKGVGVDLADETNFRLAALKEPQTADTAS